MKLACVQSDVAYGNPAANLAKALSHLRRFKDEGVDLAVFPEAFLTGYCVDCLSDAQQIAIERTSSPIETLRSASDGLDMLAIVGFAEREGDRLYNAVALFEPHVEPRFYRKTHLPELGFDRFVEKGAELPVFDTRVGRIGILICFDLRAPEPSRVLALKGAELIVLPTNWPDGAQISAEHFIIVRAAENRVFYTSCNRVGKENGFKFIGMSKIVGPSGAVLATAGEHEEVILAEIDLTDARVKRIVKVPGKYETTVFESRRPELYGPLAHQEI